MRPDLFEPAVDDLADLLLAFVGVLAQREGGVVVDVHRAEEGAVLEQQAELFAHLEEFVVGHVRDRLAVDEDVARIGVEQADDVLDQHALAGSRGAEHHRDLVLGQAEVEPVEDPRPAELFDQVDDLDRVLAAVVALAAGVEAVGIVLAGVDAGDDEVAPHHRAVLAHVRTAGLGAFGMTRLGPGDRADRFGQLGAALGLGLELGLLGFLDAVLARPSTRSPSYRRPRVGPPEDKGPKHPDDVD